MPARLPDEELAPVEGTPPPGQVVAPTDFGLDRAGQELHQAATVGYREQAFQARAQAAADARANAPAMADLQGQLGHDLAVNSQNYQSPTFIADQHASAAQIAAQARKDAGYDSMTPGRKMQWDRAEQQALDEHAQLGYRVQNTYTESALAKGREDEQNATSAQQLVGVLPLIHGLEVQQSTTNAGDPHARQAFLDGSQALAGDYWANTIAPTLSAADQQTYKPMYDAAIAREVGDGASRIGISQVQYQGAHTVMTGLQTVDQAAGQIHDNPALFGPMTAPDGVASKAIGTFGTGDMADKATEVAHKDLASAKVRGMIDRGEYAQAQAELDGHQLDGWLGDERPKLETELSSKGPAASDRATAVAKLRLQFGVNADAIASEGTGFITEDQLRQAGASPDVIGEFNAQASLAQQVFMAAGGVPISKQTIPQLEKIHAPTDVNSPLYLPQEAAFKAAQARIAELTSDPSAVVQGQQKGGGKPGIGSVGHAPSPQSAQAGALFTAWSNGGDPDGSITGVKGMSASDAGARFAQATFQGQVDKNPAHWWDNQLLFGKAQADAIATSYTHSDPAHRTQVLQGISQRIESLPAALTVSDGTVVHPRAHAVWELEQHGLPPGAGAALIYSGNNSVGLGNYVGGATRGELQKPLEGNDKKALDLAVDTALQQWRPTAQSPNDNTFYPGVRDWIGSSARLIQLEHPHMSITEAAKQAALPLTGGVTFNKTYRMPVGLANQTYSASAYPDIETVMSGGQLRGRDAIGMGMGLGTAFAVGPDQHGQVGGRLMLPPQSTLPAAKAQEAYAGIIRAHGGWYNMGEDDVFGLAIPGNGGQPVLVKGIDGKPFIASGERLIDDGLHNHSHFADPAPPQHTIQTPHGNPVNHAPPPVASAAVSGAVAAAAPPPPAAPPGGSRIVDVPGAGAPAAAAAGKSAAAEGAPGAAGGGVPAAGDYGRENAKVPAQGGAPAPPPAAPAQATAPAEPATPAQANATQQMLERLGASPRTIALFGGAEYGAQGGAPGAPEPSPYPNGLPPMNVPPSNYVSILRPAVLKAEGGAGGAVSSAGAVGLMQLTRSVVHDYAPRLGLPNDMEFFRTHDDANLQVGTALLNDLGHHYVRGAHPMLGIPMMIAAYNAGPGYVEGYTKNGVYHAGLIQKIGDPRAGTMTADQWIDRIPDKGVREYTKKIYDSTALRLAAVVGAGPAQGGGS
jgi:hypothetical protein